MCVGKGFYSSPPFFLMSKCQAVASASLWELNVRLPSHFVRSNGRNSNSLQSCG